MRSNAWTIFRLNAATRGNKLIYWLGRLPLLRRVFTDRLYAAGEGKLALFLLQNLWWVLKAIAGKVIYLAVLLLIAAFVALDGVQDTLTAANLGPFCWLFLWMSFFIGALIVPHAVAPSQLKYICVRMMAMDAWRYQMITGLGHHLAAFAGFTPLLMILTALLGAGPWAGLVIGVELAFVRLAAEGLHLAIYSRTGASVGGKVWYILLMAIAGTAGSAACLLALPQSRPQDVLLHPAVFAALAVLAILAGVTVVGAALLLFLRSPETAEVFDMVPLSLPYCVFFLYFMDNNVGTRICKAMFYNCDLAMLKYPWYRREDVVLKNFLLRFTRLGGTMLALSGAVCVMFTVLTLCAGGRPPVGEYLIFLAAILCLGVFFAVHCLGMYYLFQPYTSDLQVKNPFFSGINLAVYIVCYACIQIKSTPSWFALLVLAVTVVYCAVILTLVYRRSPRTFRVK